MDFLRVTRPFYLFSFLFIFYSSFVSAMVSAIENQSILFKVKSEKSSYCKPISSDDNEGPLGSFNLDEVPQFGAMCNVPLPNSEQLKFLLENNVTPILCMGLYDVFQRFCESEKRTPLLKEQFPLTVNETNKLFQSFYKLVGFSSLHRFCSITVKNNTITEPASLDTKLGLWWSELNEQLRSENMCLGMCRTTEEDKVNPLCSYIIWFNSLYLHFEKGFNESRPGIEETDVNLKSPNKPILDQEIESNQILSSTTQNQSTLSSTVSTVVSTTRILLGSDLTAHQVEVSDLNTNRTVKPQITIPGNNSQKENPAIDHVQESITSITSPELKQINVAHKTSQNMPLDITTKTETSQNQESMLKNKKVEKPTEKEPQVEIDVEKSPSQLPKLYDKSIKTEYGYSTPVVTKLVDTTKKTPEKTADGMVESDVTQEVTPDELEMDQPIVADKEFQQPYSDEELENGDGDDIDFEPEGPAKLAQNKTFPNNSKSNSATLDQGINDSDKVYGEERGILIEDHFIEAEDSHFFTYFLCMAVLTIMAYLAFHNKKKLLALALEGRRTRSSRRRPNSSNYSKLDCSLEEAMASSHTPASVTHVLY